MILIADKIKAKYIISSSLFFIKPIQFNESLLDTIKNHPRFIIGICTKIVYFPNEPMDQKFIDQMRKEYNFIRSIQKIINK